MQKIIQLLQKKYPIESKPAQSLKLLFFVSLFVGAFIYFFRPFGLQNVIQGAAYLWGYGLVTFLMLAFNLWFIKNVFKPVFNDENWTVLKNICWQLWIMSTIGIGNYIYTRFLFVGVELSFWEIIKFELYTLSIGTIPVTVITLITQNRYLKENIRDATSLTGTISKQARPDLPPPKIQLWADNQKEHLSLLPAHLLFVEASGNYVEVNYLKDNKPETMLLRSSLKKVQETLKNYPAFFRCHRSFIVNLHAIWQVNGNAQGYQLSVTLSEKKVPVSRSYIGGFKQKFPQK